MAARRALHRGAPEQVEQGATAAAEPAPRASSNGSVATGIHSSPAASATARTASPASAAPVATAAATARCESAGSPRVGARLKALAPHEALEQQPRAGARQPPGDPRPVEVAHAAEAERVARSDDEALIAPPQMHDLHRLAAQRAAHERVVPAAAGGVEQVQRRGVGRAASELDHPVDAPARPRRDLTDPPPHA